jgi:vancomycin resistance protein YoaR
MTLESPGRRPGTRRRRMDASRGEVGNGAKREALSARRGRRGIVGSVVLACAVLAALVALDYRSNTGVVYRGVSIGGVPVGGKTPAEARALLEKDALGRLDEIEITAPGGDFVLKAEEMGVALDAAASVQEAYAVGRRGSVGERLGERLRASVGAVAIPPEITYEREFARRAVEEVAARADRAPRDASVAVVGGEVRVERAREGFEPDVPRTMDRVDETMEDLQGEVSRAGQKLEPRISTPAAERAAEKVQRAVSAPIVLTAEEREWTLTRDAVEQALNMYPEGGELRVELDRQSLRGSLADTYSALAAQPVEASFVEDGGEVSVTEGRAGQRIENGELFEALETEVFADGRGEVEVPLAAVQPKLTTARAERLKPTNLIGRYRTDYRISGDDSPERVENLGISSGAIDGTLLAPGEVFSFNELAAPLDYNETKVIVGGKVDKADGGGLCQVASTLYMAANYAGLDVVERHPHYAELPYIRPGFDATVWFGSLDMKFENTTSGYVLLKERVGEDGYLYAEIYGRPTGSEVAMSSERVSASPDSTSWVTRQSFEQGGETLFDGVLHRDSYQPLVGENGEVIPNAASAPVNP